MGIIHEQPLANITGEEGKAFLFHCVACGHGHFFVGAIKGPWTIDEKTKLPTFTPSLKITGTQPLTHNEAARILAGEKIPPRPYCCHLNLTNGKLVYHGDCTHSMAGKTVDMVDVGSLSAFMVWRELLGSARLVPRWMRIACGASENVPAIADRTNRDNRYSAAGFQPGVGGR